MPAITNPATSTILVTGSNGFIASWIVGDLLQAGYNVRAAVRTEERGVPLKKEYKQYSDEGKLKILSVGDMTTPGAWDKAVQDVEGIIHAAAAVHLDAKTPEEMIEPAVKGILGILESIQKYGNKVQRFVYTSTCGTIKGQASTPLTLSEEDWNEQVVKNCEELGEKAIPGDMYCASKTLAEQELRKWHNARKNELNWDIVSLLPPWVFGPVKHHVSALTSLNSSSLFWYYATILGNYMSTIPPFDNVNPLSVPSHGWVDVRDVARGHTLALSVPAAGGERICLLRGPFIWQDANDAVNAIHPSPWTSHVEPFPKGIPDGERVYNITWNTTKAKDILGMEFRTLEETAKDILEDYEAHGWK
ncbi:hypothetical protein BDY19DRAFT_989932 [Irpex rosettiformis]|uniref:Uncharacterized protein n=1 Tax=Irpex rosettiformis TaxID=378272 RepID=A0ACB8UFT9_9APHY|nr:hypothetical protein BDY19DRAFT_989932 [Irpex rosettiformis]